MSNPFAEQRHLMVERQLRRRGVADPSVLAAMDRVPRHRFVPADRQASAYGDFPLSIGDGQTISQPYMVASMTESLGLTGNERVLEVGTGSGYQTAVLAELAAEVFSVERIGSLSEQARALLAELGYASIRLKIGDGTLGWPEHAPFDAILVTAGAPRAPEPLLAQMDVGARMVVPVGDRHSQVIEIYLRDGQGYKVQRSTACRFVDLVGAHGWS